jgi:hypothetical protein
MGRQIPIVGLLHGLTIAELQSRASIPILLKRRNLVPLNKIDTYLEQLRGRVQHYSQRHIEEQR